MPRTFPVTAVVEQFPEQDFCLLLAESSFCKHPPISYSKPDKCLFAQLAPDGKLLMFIVESCPPNFWEDGYRTYSPTGLGSSGGCYFDQKGALIALHLARSTGLCGNDTGAEKKGILAQEMVRYSNALFQLQYICLIPSALEPCAILYPPLSSGPCYQNEGGVVKGSLTNGNYSCQYFEVRHGTQRSLQINLRINVKSVFSSEYQLRFLNGKYAINVHESGVYSSHETEFYQQVATTFVQKCMESITIEQFEFEFRKKSFIAVQDDR